jgi:sortase A
MRRVLGALLIAAGAVLLVLVGVSYARASLARDRARTEWDAASAHTARLAADSRLDRLAAPGALALGAPMGRIIIPAIGLDEVVVEGVDDAELNAGPGHLPGSAIPGQPGNAVISAHRDRHFHALGNVALGDTIITETLAGRARWIVIARRVVASGEPALFAVNEPTLTLTTCWPIRYLGPAPDRFILTARRADRK